MPMNRRPLSLLASTFLLLASSFFAPAARATDPPCPLEVYSECWAEGRVVDTTTCTCNPFSCLGVPESDCTEIGQRLDYTTCTCVGSPGWGAGMSQSAASMPTVSWTEPAARVDRATFGTGGVTRAICGGVNQGCCPGGICAGKLGCMQGICRGAAGGAL